MFHFTETAEFCSAHPNEVKRNFFGYLPENISSYDSSALKEVITYDYSLLKRSGICCIRGRNTVFNYLDAASLILPHHPVEMGHVHKYNIRIIHHMQRIHRKGIRSIVLQIYFWEHS